jgi:hypothetical protein
MRRMQFSTATLFFLITATALLCAIAKLEHIIPYWIILPCILLACACHCAYRRKPADLTWGLIAIGWLVALFEMCRDFIRIFNVLMLSEPSPAHEIQQYLGLLYASHAAFYIFVSIPPVYLAIKASKTTTSHGRKWLVLSPIVGVVDATVLFMFFVVYVGYNLWIIKIQSTGS